MSKEGRKISWGSLILGILLLILGIYSIAHPGVSLLSVAFAFGVITVVRGIYQIIAQRELKKNPEAVEGGMKTGWLLALGIMNIVFGVIILFNWIASAVVLPYVFSALFLADAIISMFGLPALKREGTGSKFWIRLVLSVLSVIVGILMLMHPIYAAFTLVFLVGFYFTMSGIEHIIQAFRS
ncbi:MAG: HdeD family acid-resistance protein [Lachnospiraceae bacterium]